MTRISLWPIHITPPSGDSLEHNNMPKTAHKIAYEKTLTLECGPHATIEGVFLSHHEATFFVREPRHHEVGAKKSRTFVYADDPTRVHVDEGQRIEQVKAELVGGREPRALLEVVARNDE
jgi:hypothetical protein